MKANEHIIITRYTAETEEDNYEKGLCGGTCAFWSNHDLAPNGNRFKSVEEALEAVCDANCFDFRKDCWECDPCAEDDLGRFDCDFTVDVNNSEVENGSSKIKEWKEGRTKLWNCHIVVHLAVASDTRPLTADEVADFTHPSTTEDDVVSDNQ